MLSRRQIGAATYRCSDERQYSLRTASSRIARTDNILPASILSGNQAEPNARHEESRRTNWAINAHVGGVHERSPDWPKPSAPRPRPTVAGPRTGAGAQAGAYISQACRALQYTARLENNRRAETVLERHLTSHWREPRRRCRRHPQYFGWGDVNGNIPQYYYVLSFDTLLYNSRMRFANQVQSTNNSIIAQLKLIF